MSRPHPALVVALLAAIGGFGVYEVGPSTLALRGRALLTPAATPAVPSRILVVLDTVRSERTSLCGYEQPTTPTLERLARQPGARHACRVYAPGDWTLPTHASFFTGLEVPEHGAHRLETEQELLPGLSLRPLDPGPTTLAEALAGQGFQTLAVSGNPVIGPETGLVRGFARYVTGPFGDLEGERLVEALEGSLLDLKRDRPLFLFLNIADAHEPWDRIPEGHAWLAPRPSMARNPRLWWAGDRSERPGYVAAIEPLYTWGVQRADQTLARSLEVLEDRGWLGPDALLVVTSDHGELLGEHGRVGHGLSLSEPNARVFLVATGPELPELPEPMSATEAHALLLEGDLAGHPVRATSVLDPIFLRTYGAEAAGLTAVARWEGWDKWVRGADGVDRFDLQQDPAELQPRPGAPDVLLEAFELLSEAAAQEPSGDAELVEMLKAAGYVD